METIFYIFGIFSVFSAFSIVFGRKPIYSIYFLVLLILSLGMIFFTLGNYFVGSLEIIIYAGAIMIMFLFIVIMLNQSFFIDQEETDRIFSLKWTSQLFLSLFSLSVFLFHFSNGRFVPFMRNTISVKEIGMNLFGSYILVVECSSILLLAGLLVVCQLGTAKIFKSYSD